VPYLPEPVDWRERKRRRQSLTLVTMLLALLAVGGFALGAWVRSSGGSRIDAASLPLCSPTTPGPAPRSVRVNIYNATNRAGLAGRAASALGDRGFVVRSVANDPLGAKIPTSAVVRHGPKGRSAAALIAAQVVGARLALDRRTGADVDLVLGAKYVGLASATDTPAPTCRPGATPR
jgi:LytR cell envelope-related transcriptional attenuator